MSVRKHLEISVAIVLVLWFIMFSKWTSGIVNFWIEMSISALVLMFMAFRGFRAEPVASEYPGISKGVLFQVVAGLIIAFALWGVFWLGDLISSEIFDFARPQVEDVYAMKDGVSPFIIGALLLAVIGPAEELFWRGFVQRVICRLRNPKAAFFITLAIYSLAHIWSGNFMLVMAAMVAGAVWGALYWWRPSLLPALIISHSVWDALVFVVLPI